MVNIVPVSERPPNEGGRADEFIRRQGGDAVSYVHDSSDVIKLFDVVDMTWTKPLPAEYAQKYYLRKLVVKCSACKWATGYGKTIAVHLKQLHVQHEDHVGAESQSVPSESGGSKTLCSGCEASFQGVVAWKRHMLQFNPEILVQHEGAVDQVLNRFVLEQPAVSNETEYVLSEPESAQVVRSQRPAGTRRRRGRRGRGGR
jgi:hypothetical protein